ncbi:MAG: hydrogenase maturation protease [Gemmatimonadetes bacterium]|nr:hydrogenase maturation protease [Gemmatimonadota bacterium]
MSAHVVLLGCGNPSRGDDALGPALLARVRQWLADRPDLDIRIVEDFQLQVEHALDVVDADLVLFVDADASAHAPFCLRRATDARDGSYTSHELSPEALLHVVRAMSTNALGHLEVAWDELLELLNDPRPGVWDARAAGW